MAAETVNNSRDSRGLASKIFEDVSVPPRPSKRATSSKLPATFLRGLLSKMLQREALTRFFYL
jgi:hypothetical protein